MNAEDVFASAVLHAADVCYSVPGYPISGLAEKCGAEYTINEKIALEYALGTSLTGRRVVVIVKNAGMNNLADPLVSATYQGIRGGIVIIAGDDTEVSGSQTRQDSRYYGDVASVMVFEPSADVLCKSVESAMQSSENYSRIVIIRVTPEILYVEVPDCVIPERKNGIGALCPENLTMKGRSESAENITAGMRGDAGYQQVVPETFGSRGHFRTLCKFCPYKPLFAILKKTLFSHQTTSISDTGCSLLSQNPLYGFSLVNYGLGSSPAVAAKSTKIAMTGDYAILHSGLNSLIDIFEKGESLFCIVLQNRKMGMTGGQDCPYTLPYLACFHPSVVAGNDINLEKLIENGIEEKNGLKILIVQGECPVGENHETIPC